MARRTARRPITARNADRYALYQEAVQSPEDDFAFLRRIYRRHNGREALHLREDFCGTAYLSSTWVKRSPQHTAEGFDLDPEPLAWGKQHNLAPIGDAAKRVTLHKKDVREPGLRKPDLRLAQNFSYYVFQTRKELVEYFTAARKSLAKDGIFALDVYGGTEAVAEVEEPRSIGRGVRFVWEQHRYWPGTGEYLCFIHFRFRDGSKLERCFRYDWRYWSIIEVREALHEAGFRHVDSYFEQTDTPDGEGNGKFKLDQRGGSGRDCIGMVAYLVARA
ncbi:MAG: class I SAM-dependent methyltransferase [Planctomycetes bacterium]|nr:class I SAM-dependent methyltransferase [Planctomycetota bacterium]